MHLLSLFLVLLASILPVHPVCIRGTCKPRACLPAPRIPSPNPRRSLHTPSDLHTTTTAVPDTSLAPRGRGICYYPNQTSRLVTNIATLPFILPAGSYALNYIDLVITAVQPHIYFELYHKEGDPDSIFADKYIVNLYNGGNVIVSDGVTYMYLILRQLGNTVPFQAVEVWLQAL
ncbi:hypothetical protein MMC12_005603 [Toensbergia leucococca]|nr:hypothetical protein [Toensbergia leucococca]